MKFTQKSINWTFTILIAILFTSLFIFSAKTNQKLTWQKELFLNDHNFSENHINKLDFRMLAYCTNNKSIECKELLQEIADGK